MSSGVAMVERKPLWTKGKAQDISCASDTHRKLAQAVSWTPHLFDVGLGCQLALDICGIVADCLHGCCQ
jgi:hypothetical protein